MTDIKNTLLIIGGSVVVVIAVIFGLTRMGETTSVSSVDQAMLLDGARFVKENPSTSSGQVASTSSGSIKVTVVSFSDIQCPACRGAKEAMKELETTPGVRYVVRHFPLPPNVHKYALISAKAVEAGRDMGKGWEMMEYMFNKQEEWSDSGNPEKLFESYAVTLGLDGKTFTEKMKSKEIAELVQLDASLASRLQLSGTPTIFVNGEQIGSGFVVAKVKEILSKQ